MTAPIRSEVVTRSTLRWPPVGLTPLAMNTTVSVFATVQKKNASSHQRSA